MTYDPDVPSSAGQSTPSDHLEGDWCGLNWTPWAPLEWNPVRRTAPVVSGVYRVRRECGELRRLVYVGQTGRNLRERLVALAAGVNAQECPYNDPHTAAPHLWLLRRLDGAHFEFSCAPVQGDKKALRGTEDMLLWRHRLETGVSAEANYGRFYPGYARPTNRWIVSRGQKGNRIPGRAATLLAEGSAVPNFDSTLPILQGDAAVLEAPWWLRAPLAAVHSLPSGPAVYCIHDGGSNELVYVGETLALRAWAASHAVTPWPLREPWLAYLPLPKGTPKHVLRELKSDLLGWHFWQTGRAPAAQHGMHREEASPSEKEPEA